MPVGSPHCWKNLAFPKGNDYSLASVTYVHSLRVSRRGLAGILAVPNDSDSSIEDCERRASPRGQCGYLVEVTSVSIRERTMSSDAMYHDQARYELCFYEKDRL